MNLIPRPNLEIRNEELLAAEAIARTTGGLTVGLIDSYLATLTELRKLVEAGSLVPICPELTNANPSAPHTVLLETMAWLLAQMAYRLNQVPEQNLIEFARLFGIEIKPATSATTVLRFTVADAVDPVTIPIGTQISTEDGSVVFETTALLTIPTNSTTGNVAARNLASGHTLLAPNKLTKLIDNIAFVSAVTNLSALDAGTETEGIESALERMRRYQRRGERIVSTKDLEDAILNDALAGSGVVRAFPFIVNGEFLENKPTPGHTTVIVMTSAGDLIDTASRNAISALLDQAVGNQFVYLVDPLFVNFNVEVAVKLNTGSPQGAVLAAIETNLRNFYSPSREQFGRPILRSEIIAVIEGTAGVDRIEVFVEPGETLTQNTPILTAPIDDTKLLEFELPKLIDVTINVV